MICCFRLTDKKTDGTLVNHRMLLCESHVFYPAAPGKAACSTRCLWRVAHRGSDKRSTNFGLLPRTRLVGSQFERRGTNFTLMHKNIDLGDKT